MPAPNANGADDVAQRFTVILTAKQHETLLVAALHQISTSASIVEEQAANLRDTAPAARKRPRG